MGALGIAFAAFLGALVGGAAAMYALLKWATFDDGSISEDTD